MKNKKPIIKFCMWFILLSTLGVGGGIFFLLLAVVPIEEWYVQRGWSQFKIDGVMKYYVIGWVVFGFITSFVYYFVCLKKERWIMSAILCVSSIGLCIAGMNYFLNTGSAVVQASQGEVEVGERFTFGPYPEKETLKQLKEQGYDGVIALLSPTIGIEQPLLSKEQKAGEEVGIEILSMPMLPWVGDNTNTLNEIRELAENGDGKYYVHCYLGRHRVDVVKQLVSEAAGEVYELLVLQATSFERGHVVYDAQNEVLTGPFPTDEEWFTRIRRGEVKEVISLLEQKESFMPFIEKEQQTAQEMGMVYTAMPVSPTFELADLQSVVDYMKQAEHKIFVHDFNRGPVLSELETLYQLGKAIHPIAIVPEIVAGAKTIGAQFIVGPQLTEAQKNRLMGFGVEQFVTIEQSEPVTQYKQLRSLVDTGQLLYIEGSKSHIDAIYQMLYGFVYGYADYHEMQKHPLVQNRLEIDVRNLTFGPILTEEDIVQFIIPSGMKHVTYLHFDALTSAEELEQLQQLFLKYAIDFSVYPMTESYEQVVVPALNAQQGSNYVMAHEQVIQSVIEVLDKY